MLMVDFGEENCHMCLIWKQFQLFLYSNVVVVKSFYPVVLGLYPKINL